MRRRSFVQLIFGGCAAVGCAVVAAACGRKQVGELRGERVYADMPAQRLGTLRDAGGTWTYGDPRQQDCVWYEGRMSADGKFWSRECDREAT